LLALLILLTFGLLLLLVLWLLLALLILLTFGLLLLLVLWLLLALLILLTFGLLLLLVLWLLLLLMLLILLTLGLLLLFLRFGLFVLLLLSCVRRSTHSQQEEERARTNHSDLFHEVASITCSRAPILQGASSTWPIVPSICRGLYLN
jgi:hypothetical protein